MQKHKSSVVQRTVGVVISIAVVAGGAAGCGDVHEKSGQGTDAGDGSGGGGGGGDGGPGAVARCEDRSGSRIKTVVLDHGGTDADPARFIDTNYGDGVSCSFTTASDGVLRCLPAQTDGATFTGAIRVWTDAGCTSPIVEVSYEGTPTSFYVFDFPNYNVCSFDPPLYYQAGSRLPYDGSQTVYEKDQNGACVGRLAYFNRSYYTLGAEIPPTTFVAAEEKYTTDGRLAVRYADGEDGSRYCDDNVLRDTARGNESCIQQIGEDGQMRCLPYAQFSGTFYRDSGCAGTATVGTDISSDCVATAPLYMLGPPVACDPRRVLYQRGDALSGPVYYSSGGTCQALGAGETLYEQGPHVAPDQFVALSEERVPVGGRLQRVDLVGDGVRVHKDLWYDPELDSDCSFKRTLNDVLRCVPVARPGAPVPSRGAIINYYYGDPGCTQTVSAVTADCSGVMPRYVVDSGNDYAVYKVGDEVTVYYNQGSGCAPVDGTWHQVGGAMPVDQLVAAHESTE